MDKNIVLISVACIYREKGKKREWVVTKQEKDSDWELPRIAARKTESTARASIRMAGEQMGMSIKVLEEAGRAGGITTVGGKTVPQRHLYYLAKLKAETGEAIAFEEAEWLPYANAVRRLTAKRDRQMLKSAREELEKWLKSKKAKAAEEEAAEEAKEAKEAKAAK